MPKLFTPGPWRLWGRDSIMVSAPEQPACLGSEVHSAHPCLVAGVNIYGELSLEERQGNARLIAAAPDLLAACEEILLLDEHDPDFELPRSLWLLTWNAVQRVYTGENHAESLSWSTEWAGG